MQRAIYNEESEGVTWYTKIGRIKRAYGSLTAADLNFSQNQRETMIEALVTKLGVSKKEIIRVMDRVRPIR